jgi:hypothetical protein
MNGRPYSCARWPRSRFWAIRDAGGELVALVVYLRGARELLRLLNEERGSP